MDSLYEPVEQTQDTNENSNSRASSPLNAKNLPYERSLSLEFSDVKNTESEKKSKKSHIQKSVSENEAFGRKSWSIIHSQDTRKAENTSHLRRHCFIEDLSEDDFLMGERTNLLTRQTIKENQTEWISPPIQSTEMPTNETELDDTRSETMGTLKRLQKLVRSKKNSVAEEGKNTFLPLSPTLCADNDDDEEEQTLTTCMKLTKSQDKKTCKDPLRKRPDMEYYATVGSLDRSSNTKWSSPGDSALDSDHSSLSNWKTFTGNNCDPLVFSIKPIQEWEKCACCNHHTQLPPSLTDMDLPYSWRTSSFGAFDRFRKNSVSKPEHLNESSEAESLCEGGATECDKASHNAGSLTKKMKAISLTMRKKMGKKYIQALSEDTQDDTEEYYSHRDSDPEGGIPTEKVSLKASESVESLYSLNSGQSSSSGVTSCSDGTNRDSLRLDEDISYHGPFCGRAKVHTDFTPSPYDMDSLKIKKGDIIEIICKTPMGIWTGMLHNKVGNFKFIYVDVISEEEIPPRRIRARRKSKRPKPKTLQELMERLNLQDYISSLLLNGYEKLEDLKDLKESHLHELNITSSEERARLLAAIENLQDCENDQELENESVPLTLSPGNPANKCELDDCPRDSGCYISLETSENSKDEVEVETLCENVHKITITESA
ncbi:SAM domain-containing protein SAMSN-1 isoform X3 [Xenopus tropicalis]|nr:SAM domain-containing protein SAMSN-1 isoform X3 [Xenopus tropicalis]